VCEIFFTAVEDAIFVHILILHMKLSILYWYDFAIIIALYFRNEKLQNNDNPLFYKNCRVYSV